MPYQSGFRREPSLREALVIFFMVFCMVFVTNLLNSVSDLSIRITLCLCFSLSGSAQLRQLTSTSVPVLSPPRRFNIKPTNMSVSSHHHLPNLPSTPLFSPLHLQHVKG